MKKKLSINYWKKTVIITKLRRVNLKTPFIRILHLNFYIK